ncbi:MAG: hypothetical protein R3F30_08560 [Planctomycetota bacterium]
MEPRLTALTLAAAGLLAAGELRARQESRELPAGQEPAKSAPQEDPSAQLPDPIRGTNRGRFSVLRDAGLSYRLLAADKLLAEGKHAAALEALVEILRAAPSIVHELPDGSFVGLRETARERLRGLDAEGKAAFEALVRGELVGPVRSALYERRPDRLASLAARYPATASGDLARLAAGDGFLEAGNYLSALEAFSLYDGLDPDGRVRFRKLLCRRLLDLPLDPEELAGLTGPDGRRLEDWLEATLKGRGYGASPDWWPAYGGGLEGNRLASVPLDPYRRAWGTELSGIGSIRNNVHAIADGRRVYVDTGTVVEGINLLTGQGWHFESPIREHPEVREFEMATSYRHILTCALGRDVLVAPLQVPVILDEGAENQQFRGIPIMSRLPVRRLFAFEPETGRRLWSHWEDGMPLPAELADVPLDTCGPPTIIGDRSAKADAPARRRDLLLRLGVRLHTGKPLWKTFVLELADRGQHVRQRPVGVLGLPAGPTPTAAFYGTTNLGANHPAATTGPSAGCGRTRRFAGADAG